MPLKHATETLLIVVLALALALTGLAIAILPTLPAGIGWWSLALILTLAYPLSLYPLLKSRRADYPFRALHFAPFVLLLIRFALDVGSSFVAGLGKAAQWYSWGWAAPAVLVAFLALMVFCIRVLRQRDARLRILAALFLPFLFLGLFSEFTGWNHKMASLLGGGDGTIVAVEPDPVTDTGANLDPSVDAAEERWRAMLRERELRRAQLEASGSLTAGVRGLGHALMLSGSSAVLPPPSPPVIIGEVSPPSLASAGPGMSAFAVSFAALYCGLLHVRARRRVLA